MLCDERGDSLTNAMGQLDRRPALVDATPAARKRFFVYARVEIGESFAELDLTAVNGDGPEGRLHAGLRRERQIADVARQEPTDARTLEVQISRHAVRFSHVDFTRDDVSEQPHQQVEEVDADVRHQSA